MSIPDYKLEYSCHDLKDKHLKEYNIHWYGSDIGIVCMKVIDNVLEIHNIFIDEAHQHTGHGWNLITQLGLYVDSITAIDVVPQAEGFWDKVGVDIVRHPHFLGPQAAINEDLEIKDERFI